MIALAALMADASGAPTDGLAGWTVELMDRLGLLGALAVSLDNFFSPIPSEITLPLADSRPAKTPLTGALVATTAGSVFGAGWCRSSAASSPSRLASSA